VIARRVFRIPSWRLTSPFGVDTTAFAEGEPGSETRNQRLTRSSPRASSRVATPHGPVGLRLKPSSAASHAAAPRFMRPPRVRTAQRGGGCDAHA